MKIISKTIITIVVVILVPLAKVISQNHRHSISANIGYSLGKPDKRIDFLYGRYNPTGPIQTIINHSKLTTLDDEYGFGLTYRYNQSDLVILGLGVGYGLLVQDFLLPANGDIFFGRTTQPFFMRDISYYHMVQMQPSLDFKIINKPVIIGVNFNSISNISFRKKIKRFNLSRNINEYFATELYSGIYGEYKKIRLDIGHRLLHRKYRDDAIENNGLDPDPYNPAKWRFIISYKLWQSKV